QLKQQTPVDRRNHSSLGFESLEDRSVPSAASHALNAVPGLFSAVPISASFDAHGVASAGAMHASAGAHASVNTSQIVKTLAQDASTAMSTLSSELTTVAGQISGLVGSTDSTASQQLMMLLTTVQSDV